MKEKPTVAMDCECYPNFFLIAFKNIATGNAREFRAYGENSSLTPDDIRTVAKILATMRIVTFNGKNYDLPIVTLALTGATCAKLKEASDKIIGENMKFWIFERYYGIKVSEKIDSVDTISIAFGMANLKTYGGRLHSKRMADLPYDPSTLLSIDQANLLAVYCINDLDTTADLYRNLLPAIELRYEMTKEFNVDVVSKSDAQIAEAILRKGIEDLRGERVYRPSSRAGDIFKYKTPQFIKFKTPKLQAILKMVQEATFVVDGNGSVLLPDALSEAKVPIGSSVYRMGIGGLHSSEECVSHHADENTLLRDCDALSFYPNIILRLGLYPAHLGEEFLTVYRDLVRRRVTAKRRSAELKKEIAALEASSQ